jgi:hypothetical protein
MAKWKSGEEMNANIQKKSYEGHIDLTEVSNQVYDAVVVCSAFAVFAQMILLNTLLRTKQAMFLSVFCGIAIFELVKTRHKKGEMQDE